MVHLGEEHMLLLFLQIFGGFKVGFFCLFFKGVIGTQVPSSL